MKPLTISLCILLLSSFKANAQNFTLNSPDDRIVVHVTVGMEVKWSVPYNNDVVPPPSTIALELASGKTLGTNAVLRKPVTTTVRQIITSPVPIKNKIIPESKIGTNRE